MTQAALAAQLGVCVRTVVTLEASRETPRLHALALARLFGLREPESERATERAAASDAAYARQDRQRDTDVGAKRRRKQRRHLPSAAAAAARV